MKIALEFEDFEKVLASLISKAVKEELNHRMPQLPVADDLLTREETAHLLKIDLSTLWRWSKSGKLPSYGLGDRVFYKRSEIISALKPLSIKSQ